MQPKAHSLQRDHGTRHEGTSALWSSRSVQHVVTLAFMGHIQTVSASNLIALSWTPIGLANQDIKLNIFRDGKVQDKPVLMSKMRGFLRSRRCRPQKVKKYLERIMRRLCQGCVIEVIVF